MKTSRQRNGRPLNRDDPSAGPPYEATVAAEVVVVTVAVAVAITSTTATTDRTPSPLMSSPDTRLHLHHISKAVEDHRRCRRKVGSLLRPARNTMDTVLLLDRVLMISILLRQ